MLRNAKLKKKEVRSKKEDPCPQSAPGRVVLCTFCLRRRHSWQAVGYLALMTRPRFGDAVAAAGG